MANSESKKLSNKISDAEEKEIVIFLRKLDCCENDFKRLLIESRRLFVILYDHDSRRRDNVDRNAIVKSIIIIAENMINHGLHHYSWTKLRSSTQENTPTMFQ